MFWVFWVFWVFSVYVFIFTFVKSVRILAVFLVIVLMMPLVSTSITKMGYIDDKYELSENYAEEEQRDKRDSETKEGMEDIDEFMLHNQFDLAITRVIDSEYFARNKEFVSIIRDILTPPPEII